MRLIILALLMSCSHSLKYKHTSGNRYLASLTRGDIRVDRIEGSFKTDPLFASGMDSTSLIVKLYDEENNLITDVDPTDLTISTSEDLEAKPFVIKQGLYKAELMPRLKSKSVLMRIDWQEKVYSDEIVLRTTIAPLKDELVPLHHEFFETKVNGEITTTRGSATRPTLTEGFEFENLGDNRIVDSKKYKHSQRAFSFEYTGQVRQNLAMQIDDAPSETISQTMHSVFMFFPRKTLPLVEQLEQTLRVTLPNGEKMVFQKDTKEILDGVFSEGPVDVKKDRFLRSYADLKYLGHGVVLRVNSRGQSPQLGEYETDKIDLEHGVRGSAEVLIMNGSTGQRCRRPKADFWEPIDVSPIEFKFPTDAGFDQYLRTHCGFGLPKS
ncbi:MAG TPA: hypothetical protein VNJ01_09435 [Bacteriovoracaceae bacterium]|nr:hypothetical protein [Bacteriovoracaceae bacterium]